MTIFALPDLGEGLPEAEIVNWHVHVGDFVKLDQILVSVETAKAVVEIPSPIEGLIQTLYGKAGDLVQTGAPLVEFSVQTETNIQKNTPGNIAASHQGISALGSVDDQDSISLFAEPHSNRLDNVATAAGQLEIGNVVIQDQSHIFNRSHQSTYIKAAPAIRSLAQQLNIDLSLVKGTGPNGAITRKDLEETQRSLQSGNAKQEQKHGQEQEYGQGQGLRQEQGQEQKREHGTAASTPSNVPQFYEPIKGVRRSMAHSMAKSHAEVVPITIMDDAKLLSWPEKEDITVRLIQAIVDGYQKQPDLNAWFDSKTMSWRIMKELNLGIAMDTEDGLFVPVIHSAEKLNKTELRTELEKLKKQVKERSVPATALKEATFTLSNVGIFSGRYANPVVLPPMVAILAAGKIREEVLAIKGEIKICRVMPLSLTFDHRVVTGGEATRFLAAVIQSLE